MLAIYQLETLDFEEALNNFLKSKVILQQIKSLQEVVEALIFDEKLGQIDTFIRQCGIRLQIADTDGLSLQDADSYVTKVKTAYQKTTQTSTEQSQDQDGAQFEGKRMIKEIKIGSRTVSIQSLKLQESLGKYQDA